MKHSYTTLRRTTIASLAFLRRTTIASLALGVVTSVLLIASFIAPFVAGADYQFPITTVSAVLGLVGAILGALDVRTKAGALGLGLGLFPMMVLAFLVFVELFLRCCSSLTPL